MRLIPAALVLVLSATTLRAEPTEVDAELCLAVDGSGSIEHDEFVFQRDGYARALASPEVQDAIARGYRRRIALAHMEWGGADSMEPIVGWTLIDGPEAAAAFGAKLRAAPRRAHGWNSISEAIAFCQRWMESNDFRGPRMVIDVSGDAGQYGGRPLALARLQAVDAGITINALALNYRGSGMAGPLDIPLIEHYQRDVIGGFAAFALAVDSQDQFIAALKRKLVLEIAGRSPDDGTAVARSD
ncbi:MAG: DUF1194 domain-containing protein [Pseudomonadota bacterium]|nr:DUF1194 domain-containing protein [Pseudomonadota bacterium]